MLLGLRRTESRKSFGSYPPDGATAFNGGDMEHIFTDDDDLLKLDLVCVS